jgi:hypothetical protein
MLMNKDDIDRFILAFGGLTGSRGNEACAWR